MRSEYYRKEYPTINDTHNQNKSENFPEDKIAFRNIKILIANNKKLEYQMSIIEDLLKEILKEIKDCRENEM